jgi:hypothetical protein
MLLLDPDRAGHPDCGFFLLVGYGGSVAVAHALVVRAVAGLLILTVWLNRATAGFSVVGRWPVAEHRRDPGERRPYARLVAGPSGGGYCHFSSSIFEAGRTANSSVMNSSTPLWFLGDIFYVPQPLPLANVFSVGDVFIALALSGSWWPIRAQRPTLPPLRQTIRPTTKKPPSSPERAKYQIELLLFSLATMLSPTYNWQHDA